MAEIKGYSQAKTALPRPVASSELLNSFCDLNDRSEKLIFEIKDSLRRMMYYEGEQQQPNPIPDGNPSKVVETSFFDHLQFQVNHMKRNCESLEDIKNHLKMMI